MTAAVLLIIFNRPECSAQVFQAVRRARPTRLYIASDGPRRGRAGEELLVRIVRRICTAVDWPCTVHTLFRQENLGCKMGVSSAITWFFDHEEEGIVLEDDCLPSDEFFLFCESLLALYRKSDIVWAITGNNFQRGIQRGSSSYYFSKFNHVWGWASWRRAWSQYQCGIEFWPAWKVSADWRMKCRDYVERMYWSRVFDRVYAGEIDTWDYSWTASAWIAGGLTATPNVNLVSNIGFGADATHTKQDSGGLANMPIGSLGNLAHPDHIAQDVDADRYVFDYVFGGRYLRFPLRVFMLPVRLFRMLVRITRSNVIRKMEV